MTEDKENYGVGPAMTILPEVKAENERKRGELREVTPKRTGWPKGKPRGPRAKKPIPADKPEEFAGLTENSCCDACTPTHCVISGTFMPAHNEPAHVNHFGQMTPAISVPDSTICGHPLKTPVNVFVKDPRVVDRYARAKKILEHMILDSRNKGITRGR